MNQQIDTAVLLAAGRGTRMGALTSELPKPMLPLSGKPILEHVLDRLRDAGVGRALIIVGYRAEVIETHFAGYPMEISFTRQEPANGTGRAALLSESFTRGREFLLTYGDILTDAVNYSGISSALMSDPKAEVALGVNPVDDPYQGAAVYAANGAITRIIEKPPRGASTTNWNNAGLYGFRQSIYEELKRLQPSSRGEYELTSSFGPMLSRGQRIIPYELTGIWRDVGRPEDLEIAEGFMDSAPPQTR